MRNVSFLLYPRNPISEKTVFEKNLGINFQTNWYFSDATTIVSSECIEGASEDGIPFNPRPTSPY